jgi:hypothetical protein
MRWVDSSSTVANTVLEYNSVLVEYSSSTVRCVVVIIGALR